MTIADPWNKDSTASKRALDNARDAERAAMNLLVDVQAMAFIGRDTEEKIDAAIAALIQARELSRVRWAEYLDGFHQEKAA